MDSGLKINLFKSKLIGVGFPFSKVSIVQDKTGCDAAQLPFIHLGVLVGQNMI